MPKKPITSAFVDLIDISSEEFQQRKYFFYRQAIYIEKEIGLTKGERYAMQCEAENRMFKVPENAVTIAAVIPGNVYGLISSEPVPYDFVKNILSAKPLSLRFAEQNSNVLINRDIPVVTVVFDALERDEFGQDLVEESHLPAITSYLKYKALEKERTICALKAGGNYYQLSRETQEHFKDYNTFIINARAQSRFKEAEEVIEANDIIVKDDYFEYTD